MAGGERGSVHLNGARTIGPLRAAVGVAMMAAPQLVVRPSRGEPASGRVAFMVRTISVRDLALGLGTLASASRAADARRWVQFGLFSDALDVVIGSRSTALLGRGGAAAAAIIPVPFVAADLWVLGSQRGTTQ